MHKIPVALLDPHVLVRKAITILLESFESYTVVAEANTLVEMMDMLKRPVLPQIILLDVLLPGINGYDAITWLHNHHPNIKIIVLSSVNTNFAISKTVDEGISGFVSKNMIPPALKSVLDKVMEPGFETGGIDGLLIQKLLPPSFKSKKQYIHLAFNEMETRFMQLCCSNLTYVQMAAKLQISEKSTDKLRGKLFEKLGVSNRAELCLFIMSNGIHCWELAI